MIKIKHLKIPSQEKLQNFDTNLPLRCANIENSRVPEKNAKQLNKWFEKSKIPLTKPDRKIDPNLPLIKASPQSIGTPF